MKGKTGFIENLKGAFSGMFSGEYERPNYDPAQSPFSTVSGAQNFLSEASQNSYNAAVTSGNANVAEHHEIMNNRLNKMSDFMAAGGIEGGASTNGLSVYDIAQAEKMFNSDGEKIFDSVNEADGVDFFGNPIEKDDDDDNGPSHSEIIANATANAQSIASSNTAETNGPTAAETAANREALEDSLGTGASGQMI